MSLLSVIHHTLRDWGDKHGSIIKIFTLLFSGCWRCQVTHQIIASFNICCRNYLEKTIPRLSCKQHQQQTKESFRIGDHITFSCSVCVVLRTFPQLHLFICWYSVPCCRIVFQRPTLISELNCIERAWARSKTTRSISDRNQDLLLPQVTWIAPYTAGGEQLVSVERIIVGLTGRPSDTQILWAPKL